MQNSPYFASDDPECSFLFKGPILSWILHHVHGLRPTRRDVVGYLIDIDQDTPAQEALREFPGDVVWELSLTNDVNYASTIIPCNIDEIPDNNSDTVPKGNGTSGWGGGGMRFELNQSSRQVLYHDNRDCNGQLRRFRSTCNKRGEQRTHTHMSLHTARHVMRKTYRAMC